MKKVSLLILIVFEVFLVDAQNNMKPSIGVYFSNNICFTINKNHNYEPIYGYRFGFLHAQGISEKSLLKIGLDVSKYGKQKHYITNPIYI